MENVLSKLLDVLEQAIESNDKKALIGEFQEVVWNDDSIIDDELNDLLTSIAYDLDYYEPDYKIRMEEPNYYDDDKLKLILLKAINDIKLLL